MLPPLTRNAACRRRPPGHDSAPPATGRPRGEGEVSAGQQATETAQTHGRQQQAQLPARRRRCRRHLEVEDASNMRLGLLTRRL